MKSRFLFPLLLVPFASLVLAEEEKAPDKAPDPAAQFLKEAQAKHRCLSDRGLKSLTVEISIRQVADPKKDKVKAGTAYGYSWSAPDKEDFSFGDMPEASRKALAWMTKLQLWQDVTGDLCFHSVQTAKKNKVITEDGETRVSGELKNSAAYVAHFDAETLVFKRLTVPKAGYELVYDYAAGEDGFRCVSKDVLHKGNRIWKTTLSDFRKVNQFLLPTKFEVQGKDKAQPPGKYKIEYISVNGRPAETEGADLKAIKEKIKAFEKSWGKWTDEEKIAGMQALAELEHELAALAIAKRGLTDRSDEVKNKTAYVLGLIKERKVVPKVISAMKANEKNIVVYASLIWALGELGDPRAVPILSTDWWNQKIGEHRWAAAKYKLEALGKIKHVSAIDALIDTFKKSGEGWDHHDIRKTIVTSLIKLTGQNFLFDKRAWKNWWTKNRSTFRFNEE
ncbi:MAG: HEAT repeat domain-containing protein [Planctomycetota bacterium]|jgi:hypothetical protein